MRLSAVAETFEQLLSAIGFAGADQAQRVARAGRDRDRGLSDVALTGVEERRNIDESAESRGMLNSGARGLDLARQAGKEAGRATDLETAYGDEVAGANQAVMRAVAEENSRDRLGDASRDIRESEYGSTLGLVREGYQADMDSVLRQWRMDQQAISAAAYQPSQMTAAAPAFNPMLAYPSSRPPRGGSAAWKVLNPW